MSANIKKLDSRGFTLVELNLAITISAILSVAFMAIFTTFLVTTTKTNAAIQMTSDSQILLRSMVEELRYGGGVQQVNILDDLNSDEPAGGWNTSNDTAVIITAVPALDSSNQYIIDPAIDRPYYNEYIYYKEGTKLYKRTLANPDATGNKSISSCPVKTATCPADRVLIETLEDMVFTLYDQDDVVTLDPLLARSIKIDLALRKQVIGETLEFDNSIRVTLRNVF